MHRLTPILCQSAVEAMRAQGAVPSDFDLRLCRHGDSADILRIGRSCFDYNPPTQKEVAYFMSRAHAGFFGLFSRQNGHMAGYCLMEAHLGRKSLYTNTEAILPACRGQGLGQVFYDLKKILLEITEAGSIWAHIAEDNPVNLHLMKKNGYQEIRREAEYYEDGKTAIVMRYVAGSPKRV